MSASDNVKLEGTQGDMIRRLFPTITTHEDYPYLMAYREYKPRKGLTELTIYYRDRFMKKIRIDSYILDEDSERMYDKNIWLVPEVVEVTYWGSAADAVS